MNRLSTFLILAIILCTRAFADNKQEISIKDEYLQSGRVLTLNNMGWMHPVIDDITADFLKFCEEKQGANILEIGASYGYASIAALKLNANVWINDLDPRHLQIIKEEIENGRDYGEGTAHFVPGDFPSDLKLEQESFDAILAVRVLHFFAPEKLQQAANKIYKLLKKGGKVYVVCETPYLKNWEKFIPVYEARKAAGEPFPGYMTNTSDYNYENIQYLPPAIHYLDPEVLTRVFTNAGFKVEKAVFLNRTDYPDKMRLDGRESVGFIAVKE